MCGRCGSTGLPKTTADCKGRLELGSYLEAKDRSGMHCGVGGEGEGIAGWFLRRAVENSQFRLSKVVVDLYGVCDMCERV